MTARSALPAALLSATSFLTACAADLRSGAADGSEKETGADPFTVAEKIVGGQVESGYPAVGALLTADGGLCTGTLIAARWVVTAAHCLEGGVGGAVFALGNDVDQPLRTIKVTSGRAHPQYDAENIANDIAVVRLASDAGVAPMPLASALDEAEGSALTFVGFGITSGSGSNSGIKRSVEMPLAQLDATTFSYGIRGKNTCSGDSGGPAFIAQGGQLAIAGVTSYGDPGCRAYGVDTRVDVYAPWINGVTGASPPIPAPLPPADGCGDLTFLGACSGTVARWCEGGQIKENDCASGGQGCAWVDDQTGYYCVAAQSPEQQQPAPEPEQAPSPSGPCGGLDYLGQCAGDVAQWCESGQMAERNCAGFGQRCGYVSEQVGYYCR